MLFLQQGFWKVSFQAKPSVLVTSHLQRSWYSRAESKGAVFALCVYINHVMFHSVSISQISCPWNFRCRQSWCWGNRCTKFLENERTLHLFSHNKVIISCPFSNNSSANISYSLELAEYGYSRYCRDILEVCWRHKVFDPALASIPLVMVYYADFNVTVVVVHSATIPPSLDWSWSQVW